MAIKKKSKRKAKKKSAKKSTKKKVGVNAKSRATKKAPSKRLKKRRKANVKKGYFPNPLPTFYVGYILQNGVKFYYHGFKTSKKAMSFKDDVEGALWYRSPKAAREEIQYLTGRTTGDVKTIKTEKYVPK